MQELGTQDSFLSSASWSPPVAFQLRNQCPVGLHAADVSGVEFRTERVIPYLAAGTEATTLWE